MQVLKSRTHLVALCTIKIMGNRQQNAETQTVPVKEGDYIEFTHIGGEAQRKNTCDFN